MRCSAHLNFGQHPRPVIEAQRDEDGDDPGLFIDAYSSTIKLSSYIMPNLELPNARQALFLMEAKVQNQKYHNRHDDSNSNTYDSATVERFGMFVAMCFAPSRERPSSVSKIVWAKMIYYRPTLE